MGAHRNSARFSAHRKYLCRSLRLCALGDLAEHFHLWTRGRRKRRKRQGETRPERRTGRTQWSAYNNGSSDWEKWNVTTWSARKNSRYVRIYEYIHIRTYTRASVAWPPARDVLFRSATNGPRRLLFNDYKYVRDTCITFIHYHLPFPNRLRIASCN